MMWKLNQMNADDIQKNIRIVNILNWKTLRIILKKKKQNLMEKDVSTPQYYYYNCI